MARPESIAKGGYYAFPDEHLISVAALLPKSSSGGRLLDPCAGEGRALDFLSKAWGLDPYAIELEKNRADICAGLFSHGRTLREDMFLTDIQPASMAAVFCNPPFTWDIAISSTRREFGMLKHAWQWLAPGGVMIFVSYSHHITPQLARFVSERSSSVNLFRLPSLHFDTYMYTVLIAQSGYSDRSVDDATRELVDLAYNKDMPLIDDAVLDIRLPAVSSPKQEFYFHRQRLTIADMLEQVKTSGADQSSAYKLAWTPTRVDDHVVTPAIRPKLGHILTLIASGMFNYLSLETPRGHAILRSLLYRGEEIVGTEKVKDGERVTIQIKPKVRVSLLYEDGFIEYLDSDESLRQLIQQYKDQLFAYAEKKFVPRYSLTESTPFKTRWMPHLNRQLVKGKSPLFSAQRHVAAATIATLIEKKRAILVGEMSTGKAQPLDAKILTPSGWKLMGDIQVGDKVINSQGGSSTVLGVYPQGEKEIYRVTFNDGSSTECCDDHLWQVSTFLNDWKGKSPVVMPLKTIRQRIRDKANNRIWRIPLVKPIEFEAKQLPIDPYLLGVLIGDGYMARHSISFSTADEAMLEMVSGLLPKVLSLKHSGKYDWALTTGKKRRVANPVLSALQNLGLSGKRSQDKFIPAPYKYASIDQRLALLQGLMDTDGYGDISPSFTSVSKQLADDVRELVWSLGGYASLSKKTPTFAHNGEKRTGQMAYTINIHLPPNIQVFRLQRKQEAHKLRKTLKAYPVRSIESVEFIGVKQAQCIHVDSSDHLYVTDDYVLTHNTPITLAILDAWYAEGKIKPGQVCWINCPSHLVLKWQREASKQVPHARTNLIALEIRGKRRDMLADLSAAMKYAEREPNRLHIIIASQDSIKLGEGWKPSVIKTKRRRSRYKPLESVLVCPATGIELTTEIDDTIVPTPIELLSEKRLSTRNAPIPGYQALWQETRTIGMNKSNNGRAVLKDGKVINLLPNEPILDEWIALKGHRAKTNPRGPVWKMLKARYKGRIAVAVFDEVHESQSISTDRYQSMAAIANCSGVLLGLSGTIFNGYADSLYGLETVFFPQLFKTYEWGKAGVDHWMKVMGVLEKVIDYKEEYRTNGTHSGTKRIAHGSKKAPGVSPMAVPQVIDHAIFFALKDLGKDLPLLQESPVGIPMSDRQAEAYNEGAIALKDYLLSRKKDGDATFLGAYFQSLLAYPDTAFMSMHVEHHWKSLHPYTKRIVDEKLIDVHAFPALNDPMLPKEEWLINLISEQKARGRGVGVFVQHTGERNYQQRMVKLIQAHVGAKAVVLQRDTVKPIDREEWVEQQFDSGADVLICNPALVQTGLDLVCTPTLIFFEPEIKLSTLQQASRRHWRIPQEHDCETYYAYYEGTMQEQVMALVASKLAASSVLNGDSAALSALGSTGDLLKELMTGDVPYVDLRAEFAMINSNRGGESDWDDGSLFDDDPIQLALFEFFS